MKTVRSQVVPIPREDIDTDLIIPAQYLKITTKEGLGEYIFAELREKDENFPLNLEKYKDGRILVVGENFGCGSSREHAPWALADWGFGVVIAPSFADIFYSNAFKNGILLVELPEKVVEKIFEKEKAVDKYEVEVDLVNQRVVLHGGDIFEFEIDPYKKECLIKGMDDLDYLLSNMGVIDEHFN